MSKRAKIYLQVLVFGFLGAVLRYLLEWAFGNSSFPYATLCINLLGCFAIELVNDFLGRRLHVNAGTVRAVATGMVGAFSTLSAFSGETLSMLMGGDIAMALIYIACTWIGCFLAALAGHHVTRLMAATRLRRLSRARAARRELRAHQDEVRR